MYTKSDVQAIVDQELNKKQEIRLKDVPKLLEDLKQLGKSMGHSELVTDKLKEISSEYCSSNVIFSGVDAKFLSSIAFELKESVGMWPLGFSASFPKAGEYTLYEQPQFTFKPKLLMVSSNCIDGELIQLYCGNQALCASGTSLPLSIFAPIAWQNPELMAKASLNLPIVSVANRIGMIIRARTRMEFSAMIFGRLIQTSYL
jgi:hypothetical protein